MPKLNKSFVSAWIILCLQYKGKTLDPALVLCLYLTIIMAIHVLNADRIFEITLRHNGVSSLQLQCHLNNATLLVRLVSCIASRLMRQHLLFRVSLREIQYVSWKYQRKDQFSMRVKSTFEVLQYGVGLSPVYLRFDGHGARFRD